MVLDHQKFWSHMSGIVGWVTGAIWTASQNKQSYAQVYQQCTFN